MTVKGIWQIVGGTARIFIADKTTRLSAALAYYSVFSIGPLLMIVIAFAGLAFGEDAVRGRLYDQLQGLVGANAAASIEDMVKAAYRPTASVVTSIIGVVMLLIGATGVIVQLKDSLDTIWGVEAQKNAGFKYFLKTYVASLAAIIGIGFLMIVSLVATAVIAAFGTYAAGLLPLPESALQLANALVSFVILTALFGFMFKFLPDVRVPWRLIVPGALFTALMFSAGKHLLGLYLGKASIGSMYGAAGSIVVLLVWVYYSSLIFLVGAELTRSYADFKGSKIEPTRYARRVLSGSDVSETSAASLQAPVR